MTRYSSVETIDLNDLDDDEVKLLHHGKDKFLQIFQILDTEKNGTVSREEFLSGIEMLNEKLSVGEAAMDMAKADKLYDQFDLDKNGELDIQEFCQLIKKSKTLRNNSRGLGSKQIHNVKEHDEMLLMAFKYMDKDRGGTIDRVEFERVGTVLNKRLPADHRLKIHTPCLTSLM